MSAVFNHRWSIGPELDLSGKTVEELDALWKSTLGELDMVRFSYLSSLRWNGLTEPLDYLTEFDLTARVMNRKRQFVDVAAAQEWSTWLEGNLPANAGAWSKLDSSITDNAVLPRTGRYFI